MPKTNFDQSKLFRLPRAAGVGFKPQHFRQVIDTPNSIKWLEIHAENYMGDGGRPIAQLKKLRESFPISCHGVGLSIGGQEPLDQGHLVKLQKLIDWLEPNSFSEHLAWSTHEDCYLADLLPLPYTTKTLNLVCEHIDQVQETLRQPMLLENPSNYLEFEETDIEEVDFLAQISQKTGCGLLLDVNNVHVSAVNRNKDAKKYIRNFPLHLVGEIHLGGHEIDTNVTEETLLIDNHASEVAVPVWELYRYTIECAGPIATLIEWDTNVPDWPTLAAEAGRASAIIEQVCNKKAPDQ